MGYRRRDAVAACDRCARGSRRPCCAAVSDGSAESSAAKISPATTAELVLIDDVAEAPFSQRPARAFWTTWSNARWLLLEPSGSKWSKRGVPGGCVPESPGLGAGFGSGLGSGLDHVTPRTRSGPAPPPASVIRAARGAPADRPPAPNHWIGGSVCWLQRFQNGRGRRSRALVEPVVQDGAKGCRSGVSDRQ